MDTQPADFAARSAARPGAPPRLAFDHPQLPPGPRMPPAVQLGMWMFAPIQLMERARRRYGKTFTLRMSGADPFVFVTDPEHVKEVFTGPVDALAAGQANVVLEPLLGRESLILLDGDKHLRHRRLLLPPFHGERMHTYGEIMRDLSIEAFDRCPRETPFALDSTLQAITLDVILRTVFGTAEGAETAALRAVLIDVLDLATSPLVFLSSLQRSLAGIGPWDAFQRSLARVHEAIDALVARRRGIEGPDVLSMLLAATDEEGKPLSDEEIRSELLTLLLAGHETTATSLAWSLSHLTASTEWLGRAIDEVDRVAPRGQVDPRRVGELKVLDAIARESLRLTPVIPIVVRRLQRPLHIAGLDLPAGAMVTPCLYLTHRDPDVFPAPGRFDPSRFLDETKKVGPYELYPFGGGIRRCIGMSFALYEMRVVLAALLGRYVPRAAADRKPGMKRRSITFAPKDGMRLSLIPR